MAACRVLNSGSFPTSLNSLNELINEGEYVKLINWVQSSNCMDICFNCLKTNDGFTVCKEIDCPAEPEDEETTDPEDTDTDPDDTDTDPDEPTDDEDNGPKLNLRQTRRQELNLEKAAKPNSPTESRVNNEFKEVQDYLKDNNCGHAWPLIYVQREPNKNNDPQRVVLFGSSQSGTPHMALPVEKRGNDWGFIDLGEWQKFPGSNWCRGGGPWNESKKNLKDILMEEENNSLSQMIDDKLREFNFYSANDKGKQKVVFTDEDREEISKEFDDLIKKYPEDIAFIRAVVLAKGVDKKTEDPVVRLGSYYNNADIELPFNSQMNGLGKLLDGGVIYFTIINNEGPDLRDFKIVGGDKIPEIEFQEKDKEEIELDNYTHSHDQEMAEMDEPFEEVMKKKEQKGLASLLEKGNLTNDLTKRQKEVLENLKKKGFKFEKPENADIYERVRVSSKEFNESIKAWKPRK